jgi:hypothetical protein
VRLVAGRVHQEGSGLRGTVCGRDLCGRALRGRGRLPACVPCGARSGAADVARCPGRRRREHVLMREPGEDEPAAMVRQNRAERRAAR